MKRKVIHTLAVTLVGSVLFSGLAEAKNVKVEAGDTLSKLSRENNTSVLQLKKWNNLSSDRIYVGQTLQVSESDAEATTVSTSSTTGSVVQHGYAVLKTNLNMRSGPSMSSSIVRTLKKGTRVKVYAVNGSWYNVGGKQWISASSSYVSFSSGNTQPPVTSVPAPAPQPASQPSTSVANVDIITLAKKYMGTPYVWGGYKPGGFDCSGFMYYLLNQTGTSVGRTNVEGYWAMASKTSNPQPGDFIFFQNTYKKGPSHMGVYLGNGEFIHASTSKGVTISSLSTTYYKTHFLGYGSIR